MRLRFSPDARRDRREAEAFYRHRSPAAAVGFREELERALQFIIEFPLGAPAIDARTRAKAIARYPYSVLYEVRSGELLVLAIAHHSRETTPSRNNP